VLTPRGALGWLRTMSVDVRAAAVVGADGALLAGDPALLAAGAQGADGGDVVVARSRSHTIVVRCGPCAIERLLRADLRTALDALAPR